MVFQESLRITIWVPTVSRATNLESRQLRIGLGAYRLGAYKGKHKFTEEANRSTKDNRNYRETYYSYYSPAMVTKVTQIEKLLFQYKPKCQGHSFSKVAQAPQAC